MRRFLHKILFLFLIMLIIPLSSLTARAEDSDAKLHSLHFDIALQEDGSALITETRKIVFTGDREYTRYGVNNIFTGPRVFSNWQVTLDETPLSQLDEPDNENRPENTFAVEDGDGENTIYIYFRQQDSGTRVFKISYRVENAVKLHTDVAEFFWNLTGENGISDIDTLTATLTVPMSEEILEEDFYIWAHGPLNGTFEKQPDGSAALQVENVPLGTVVDIRSVLPVYCFYSGWEHEGEVLEQILAEEKELADIANAKREEEAREQAKREKWEAQHPILYPIERICSSACDFLHEYGFYIFFISLFILLFASPFIVVLTCEKVLSMRHGRKLKKFRNSPTQSPQYYRELPDDRSAPAVERLIHFYEGKSDVSRQISATLLELNLKKQIQFRTTEGDATILLNERQGDEEISDYQKTLWDFIWRATGRTGQISMTDLKQYIKDNQKEALKFRNSFESAVEKDFAEKAKSKNVVKIKSRGFKYRLIVSAVVGILAMLIRMFSALYDGIQFVDSLEYGLLGFVAALILLSVFMFWKKCYDEPCYVLDQQAENDLALWQAFGRFLDDFITFEDKELPDFSLWQEYMVYAVAMGRGQKVAESLALKLPKASFNEADPSSFFAYDMIQNTDYFDSLNSIGQEVADVRDPSISSDSGDGGGFSDSGGGSDSGSGGDFID